MNCKKMRRVVHRYLDGECRNERESALVENHLSFCDGCRRYRDEIGEVKKILSGIVPFTADEIPAWGLLSAYKKRSGGSAVTTGLFERLIPEWAQYLPLYRLLPAAAAFAAAVLFTGTLVILRGDRVNAVEQFLLQGVPAHEALYISDNERFYLNNITGDR